MSHHESTPNGMSYPAHDAILILSFGGPEGREDVVPFLRNVTRGRDIPERRLREVAEHYYLFGGKSPINGHCRALIAALKESLREKGPELPVYWGNRNWHPMLVDTVAQMAADGIKRAVAVATSAYSSYSSCRQYLDDIERARKAIGPTAPRIEKIPPYYNHPGFIETMAHNTRVELDKLGQSDHTSTRIVFTAHSIPDAMAQGCDYELQLREAAALITDRVAVRSDRPPHGWDLAYQSRSGPPSAAWLEPDICDHIRVLAAQGIRSLVIAPIGFVADHMEVIYDLDTEAAAVSKELDVRMLRAATVGAAPLFVEALRELIDCHTAGKTPPSLAASGPRAFPCAQECCARSVSPALGHF